MAAVVSVEGSVVRRRIIQSPRELLRQLGTDQEDQADQVDMPETEPEVTQEGDQQVLEEARFNRDAVDKRRGITS